MDISKTVIPRSDQINFEDVQTTTITAEIKAVRAGNKEQPVFIDLAGFDGRPYKPSKSMRRILIGGWGNDGHKWVGKTLTIYGDRTIKYGGVAVGGIKIKAMSDIDGSFSMMLTESRGRRREHFVEKIAPPCPLQWFTNDALNADLNRLEAAYNKIKKALEGDKDKLKKLDEVYSMRKSELGRVNNVE